MLVSYRNPYSLMKNFFDDGFSFLYEPYPFYARNNRMFYYEEDDNGINIFGQIPKNFNKDLININVEKIKGKLYNVLIHIKYQDEKKDTSGNVYHSIQSEIKESFHVDGNKFRVKDIKAKLKNGNLYINIPKQEKEPETIPIEINVSESEDLKEIEQDENNVN